MNHYINLKKSNCENCYKCIRNCPVKSISFSDRQAYIVEDECILCGKCFVDCPQNAKVIRNDVDKAKAMIASKRPVYASIAPSFTANYDGINIRTMENALRRLGFSAAEETAIGATVVKKKYEEIINGKRQSVIISSCCHSVNTLIQKYYPDAIPCLAHVVSPMEAHCQKIKKENPEAYTVFIGPCISKKAEADQYPGVVDCVLTYEELSRWLADENIAFEFTEDNEEKFRARLFPTAGGIIRSMDCDYAACRYISIDGIENCIKALQDIIQGNIKNCFIEMSACAGSCTGGPAMDKNHKAFISDAIAVNQYAGQKDYAIEIPDFQKVKKDIPFIGISRQMPGSKTIEEILIKMGKTTPDKELNCGSCGYNTCRDKAVAIYWGKAELSMCLPYLKEKAESFSDNIINNTPNGIMVLNEDLEIQQINIAACRMFNLTDEHDALGIRIDRILQPGIYVDALTGPGHLKSRREYLEAYEKYIDETIIYDKSYHIIISIMRDITEEETQRCKKENIRHQTIDVTDKIIEKQMRVVQEIASLLGETTAETRIALTHLKRTLNDE